MPHVPSTRGAESWFLHFFLIERLPGKLRLFVPRTRNQAKRVCASRSCACRHTVRNATVCSITECNESIERNGVPLRIGFRAPVCVFDNLSEVIHAESAPQPSLQRPYAAQESGADAHDSADTGARRGREYRDLHCRLRHPAGTVALSPFRAVDGGVVEDPGLPQRDLRWRLHGLEAGEHDLSGSECVDGQRLQPVNEGSARTGRRADDDAGLLPHARHTVFSGARFSTGGGPDRP